LEDLLGGSAGPCVAGERERETVEERHGQITFPMMRMTPAGVTAPDTAWLFWVGEMSPSSTSRACATTESVKREAIHFVVKPAIVVSVPTTTGFAPVESYFVIVIVL